MPKTLAVERITADDATIREALVGADLASLTPALVHMTGDLSLLRDEFRPNPLELMAPQAGISDEAQVELREIAFKIITAMRDGTFEPAKTLDDDAMARVIDFLTGSSAGEYAALLREELDLADADPRAPAWTKDELAKDRPFNVVVIGAGMSGLLAAHRLAQAGVPFVVLEKNEEVGGTWFENTYPDCRVDNPNHAYSYSFVRYIDWPRQFSPQPVLLEYFRRFADDFGLRESIRFGTEAESVAFDEERCVWILRTRGGDVIEANAVISAVGQLNRPKMPDIPGRDSFRGPAFHSARWDRNADLEGKRVAVIGTGASAAQLIPVVAGQASELVIFQRTPNWFFPVPNYHDSLPEGLLWLFRHVPGYSRWYRAWLFWRTADGLLPNFEVDLSWDGDGRSVSAANDFFRQMLTGYIEGEFADRPDLLPEVVPDYPVCGKRVIMDNGIWASTLKRDNVQLVTAPIGEITPDGVRTKDGTDYPVDVIIYGTGFQASKFLTPMCVEGRGGIDMNQQWDGDARAYLGITVPNFPNFFMMYGPNTNIVINGSIVYFSECEVHYILDSLRAILSSGARAIDCKPEVHDAYNVRIDDGNKAMAWGAAHVNTWYRNDKGRISQNWPFTMLEFWKQTRNCNLEDYELL
jgi:4-hydroxyacetophenone monooxygenase